VVLGDLVNRGPQSLAVLQRLRGLGAPPPACWATTTCTCWRWPPACARPHRSDTLDDILQSPRPRRLARLAAAAPPGPCRQRLAVRACRRGAGLGHGTHAGTGAEVEALLQGPDLPAFLQVMYGNEPRRWQRRPAGRRPLALVINTLTRIRFCSADGELEFGTKDGADAAPAGLHALVRRAGPRHRRASPMAFGHWSTLGLI
jgi:bis(5'-nucleosyl)-tetraphosphatase (symmetrical)